MEKNTKRKAFIAGSAMALTGALTGVVMVGTDGPDAKSPQATGAVRAQHVDLADPSTSAAPGGQPAPADSPAVQPSHESLPDPHHKFLDLKVKNPNNFQVQACVDNSAVGVVCTKSIGSLNQEDELDHVTVDPTSDTATVSADIPVKGTGGRTRKETLQLPVSLDTVTTHCVRFTETTVRGVTTRDMVEARGCIAF